MQLLAMAYAVGIDAFIAYYIIGKPPPAETLPLFILGFHMVLDNKIVGEFIDAAVRDQTAAAGLLRRHPELRSANFRSETALHFLVTEGFVDAAVFCIENGFDVNRCNDYGDTPLMIACQLGNSAMVVALLARGADPNLSSDANDCPLHCCLQHGRTDLMAELLDAGADPYYTTALEETIFDLATNDYTKRQRVSAFLAERGIDITKAFPDGE
tara:strand:- start:3417 stop:4055 length:639 start_codon:yes stop_codon:yes gene_type:complete